MYATNGTGQVDHAAIAQGAAAERLAATIVVAFDGMPVQCPRSLSKECSSFAAAERSVVIAVGSSSATV